MKKCIKFIDQYFLIGIVGTTITNWNIPLLLVKKRCIIVMAKEIIVYNRDPWECEAS